MQCKYTEAYNCIKAPKELREKVMSATDTKRAFNYKSLISVAACVIILAAMLPAYMGITNPDVSVIQAAPMTARFTGIQIPLEFDLHRSTIIETSDGVLDGYNRERVKGSVSYVLRSEDTELIGCTVTLKDPLKTTVYVIVYNENNGSWSIIKN